MQVPGCAALPETDAQKQQCEKFRRTVSNAKAAQTTHEHQEAAKSRWLAAKSSVARDLEEC